MRSIERARHACTRDTRLKDTGKMSRDWRIFKVAKRKDRQFDTLKIHSIVFINTTSSLICISRYDKLKKLEGLSLLKVSLTNVDVANGEIDRKSRST